MLRKIIFPVPDNKSRTIVRDPSSPDGTRKQSSERYAELRMLLATFGTLILERTSGTFRRVSTPPLGMHQPTERELEEHDLRDAERRKKKLFEAIPGADCFIAPADSGIDETMREAIEIAIADHVPVLLLQQTVLIEIASRDLYRKRIGVSYQVYRDARELRTIVVRFMDLRVPMRHSGGAGY